jgi:hypothetical protein
MLIILSAICTESGAVRRMSAEPECFHKDAHYLDHVESRVYWLWWTITVPRRVNEMSLSWFCRAAGRAFRGGVTVTILIAKFTHCDTC